jgi:hypothetical protein
MLEQQVQEPLRESHAGPGQGRETTGRCEGYPEELLEVVLES